MKAQENNRGNNRWIEYDGKTHTISEWSEIVGIRKDVLYHRFKRGWSVERALCQEKRRYVK